ncbi:MAG: TonB-dependent receptor [Alphaproteobacteria bacterium]|nr:TonB-dependent receptor [Alphaproteobacteria bacterium]
MRRATTLALGGLIAATPALAAEPDAVLDEVSVTASRLERPTLAVPQSTTVVGAEKIEKERMENVGDALEEIPGVLAETRNGGYDTRLIIRGAGLKARYGVREITILRDGVPMTDPDSFTRFDFIDTQDIQQVEVVKGPGNVNSAGAAGGVVQINSKSVFDTENDTLKLGGGVPHRLQGHARWGGWLNEEWAASASVSHRESNPDWRAWNDFSTSQGGAKLGWAPKDGGRTFEGEVSYSEADLQIPGAMNRSMYQSFERTGEQTGTSSAFKQSGRYSSILFANGRYEQTIGDWTIKPRLYVTRWEHVHPVTGAINVNPGNWVFGGDLEGDWKHQLGRFDATLATGVTMRRDTVDGEEKYAWADTVTSSSGRITATNSDRRGNLLERSDAANTLYGAFVEESIRLTPTVTLDAGLRADRVEFDIQTEQFGVYDYARGMYLPSLADILTDTGYTLVSPRIGVTWEYQPGLAAYASLARGDQVPSSSELAANPNLRAATSTNYEVGLKGRRKGWGFDAALYWNPVEDEITQVVENGRSLYQNAGQTEKLGTELAAWWSPVERLTIGGHWAWSRYRFDEFTEVAGGMNRDLAGKTLPFVPEHQYGFFARWAPRDDLWLRVDTRTWGEYWMDNANTMTYPGYQLLTDVSAGWEVGRHSLRLSIDNIFDQRYASEANKDATGNEFYYSGEPLSALLTYVLKL